MKKLFASLALLSGLILATPVSAESQVPAHTDKFYVNDFANVLSDETEQHIFENSKRLDEETGAQIVVVAISNLDGRDIESYTTELFREWGIGDSEKNSGLLFLVSIEDRRLRIEVGYGLEGILPDGKVGRIRDEQITPSLKDDKWDEGVLKGYDALFAVVDENREEIGKAPPPSSDSSDWLFVFMAFGIIGGLIFAAAQHPQKFGGTNGGNSSHGRGWGPFGMGGGFGGGGFGGGGGGGFGGGGGSSGGGGASGGF